MPAPADFLTALGMAFTGYGKDKQQHAENAIAQQRATMESQLHGAQMGEYQAQADERRRRLADKDRRDTVLAQHLKNAIAGDQDAVAAVLDAAPEYKTILTKEPPKGTYDAARGVIVNPDGTVVTPQGLPPKPPTDVHDHFTFVTGVGPDGKPVIYKANTLTGEMTASEVKKPEGAQSGRDQNYVDLMRHAIPIMQELQMKVRPWAIAGALKNPTIGNAVLSADEQRYLSAARDFLVGDLHAESGARLSHEQVAIGQQRYFPNLNDKPAAIQAKLQSAINTYLDRTKNAGGHSAPGAATAPGVPKVKTGNVFLDGSDDD